MRENYIKIKEYVNENIVKFDEPMSKHTTLKVGGPADVFVTPECVDDIKCTVEFAKKYNVPVTVIGNGSKLLVLDSGIRGIVLKIGSKFSNVNIDNENVIVDAGMSVPRLAIIVKDNSLTGLEFAAGIPGNIGGAIFMNAGAYGGEMSSIVTEVTYLDENLEIKTLTNEELEFGYRNSFFRSTSS